MSMNDEDGSLFLGVGERPADKHQYDVLFRVIGDDADIKIVRCDHTGRASCNSCIGRKYREECPCCTSDALTKAEACVRPEHTSEYGSMILAIYIKLCSRCGTVIYTCGTCDVIAFKPSLTYTDMEADDII